MKITFLHPDLGIGGAERLVVDAALALKSKNHKIRIVTNHHDPKHSFVETTNNSLKVDVVGEWIPRSVFGKCFALCAYLRMMYAAFLLAVWTDDRPDIVFCDQVSACIPILKWKKIKVIFYCHFPDQLLTDRKSFLKRLYRWPLDWLEEKTTGMANIIFVNSKFTAQTVQEAFPSLDPGRLEVLYPCIDADSLLCPPEEEEDARLELPTSASTVFLSLNRYERKKDLGLAIRAMECLREQMEPAEFSSVHLVVAGGYDARVAENVEHFRELSALAARAAPGAVTLLRSPPEARKRALLRACAAVLYTPPLEHFGIVALEAGAAARPVVACAAGGPLETVRPGATGLLCPPGDARAFAAAMRRLARDPAAARAMGRAAAEHVRDAFSPGAFARRLGAAVAAVAAPQ